MANEAFNNIDDFHFTCSTYIGPILEYVSAITLPDLMKDYELLKRV